MDVTKVFKATIKAVKSRNKALGETNNDKSNLLSTAKHKGDFEIKAKEVVTTVTRLRDFLLENRKEYVNPRSHLMSKVSSMTDSERDQIDDEAEKIIRMCRETLSMFRKEANASRVYPQVKEHRHAVMTLLDAYLKVVCKIYSEQRAVRVKRVVDKKRISRLQPERRKTHVSNLTNSKQFDKHHEKEMKESDKPAKPPLDLELKQDNIEEEDISPEEAQMFEQENQSLYEEMNSMSDEVRQIEGKVIEIAKLQEIFTENILEQEKDIDRIASTTVGTTENIKDANEDIREAIKNKAEFRVWILFFIVMCSFSLLFLDWYNG